MSTVRQAFRQATPEHGREDFVQVRKLYDVGMPENNLIHDLVYPHVYGEAEYIGQFSDNSASELLGMGEALEPGPGAAVLDIGCGTAAIACFLASRLGWNITGIDLSTASLRKARQHVQARGLASQIHLVEGNLYAHRFEGLFDGIYGTGSFCHFEAAPLFTRCWELLRPGGRLAFMERVRLGDIPAPQWKRVTEDWACPSVYTVEQYHSLLRQAGFRVLEVMDQTETFKLWQERSVWVRQQLRERIVELTSEAYYDLSLNLASYENELTRSGRLGYVRVVAEAQPPSAVHHGGRSPWGP
jgi:cyclopropane fatty-acyl-phospholipid synthase-like methyltransferase